MSDLQEPVTRTDIEASREVFRAQIDVLKSRLDGMDKALELFAQSPTAVDKAIENLRALHNERFKNLEDQVSEKSKLIPQVHSQQVRLAAIDATLVDLQDQMDKRLLAQKESTSLALTSVHREADLGRMLAEKAVVKAEAAADKQLLESQINSLREQFLEQILSLKEKLQAALASIEKAVDKAEVATEKRFEGVNEFRAQLTDQASTFMPRREAESWRDASSEKIDTIASRLNRSEGRGAGVAAGWGMVVTVITVVAAIIGSTLAILAFNN